MLLVNHNFKYNGGVHYTYDEHFPCQEGSDCCDNDYCRCGEITNYHVYEVNIRELVSSLSHDLKMLSELDLYALDRIASVNQMWNPTHYETVVEGGYYGDELGPVTFNSKLADQIDKHLHRYKCCKTDAERVEYLLKMEYGSVPEKYRNRTWTVKNVSPNNIFIGNKNHFKRSGGCDFYEGYPHFIAITMEVPRGYEIIDGYHRLAANFTEKTVKVLVGR